MLNQVSKKSVDLPNRMTHIGKSLPKEKSDTFRLKTSQNKSKRIQYTNYF